MLDNCSAEWKVASEFGGGGRALIFNPELCLIFYNFCTSLVLILCDNTPVFIAIVGGDINLVMVDSGVVITV